MAIEELERVLQTFYLEYPERKDVRAYIEHVGTWQPKLESVLQRELIEAIAFGRLLLPPRAIYLERLFKENKEKDGSTFHFKSVRRLVTTYIIYWYRVCCRGKIFQSYTCAVKPRNLYSS